MFLILFVLAPDLYLEEHMAQPTHIERILVVTDDPDTADLIAQQALGPMHYHVRVVQTVGEAGDDTVCA